MFAADDVSSGRSAVLRLRQKEHRTLAPSLARVKGSRAAREPPFLVRSASATQASQINTSGPAMSLATWLSGRSQKVQIRLRLALRERQTRCHQLPPALPTI